MFKSNLVESISIDNETGYITIKKQGLKEAKIMTCPLTKNNDFCNIDCIACYYKETTSQISIYCKQFFKFHCYKEEQTNLNQVIYRGNNLVENFKAK